VVSAARRPLPAVVVITAPFLLILLALLALYAVAKLCVKLARAKLKVSKFKGRFLDRASRVYGYFKALTFSFYSIFIIYFLYLQRILILKIKSQKSLPPINKPAITMLKNFLFSILTFFYGINLL